MNGFVLRGWDACPTAYTMSPRSGQKLVLGPGWEGFQPLFFSKIVIGRVLANQDREKTPWMFHAAKK